MEEWRDCVGFEGFYQVSNEGRVRSLAVWNALRNKIYKRKSPVLKKIETTREGYKRVLLSYYGVHHHCAVHRLVAQAFIPNPNNYPCINHKDETHDNNHVENLEWCTYKYNSNYGTLPQRIRERMNTFHPSAMPVCQYDMKGNFIAKYKSQREAGRVLGIRGENISRNIKGKYKHAGGCIWKISEKSEFPNF